MISENASSLGGKFLIDEREEVMVSEKGHSLKKTHFLKPFVTSIDGGLVAELPVRRRRLSVSSSDMKRLSSRISFSGFWVTERHFVSWVGKMEALHGHIWRKAGIFEAIKASTYTITKNHSLILSLAEKWCPETKSFLFPWGEATITLEDVMVLLGFSVSGSPVFASVENSEMRDSMEKLNKERLQSSKRDSRVSQISWISKFLGRGDEMEHEAFLVLWLSHFVFPGTSRRTISKNVIPIAIRLARGEKIALAPAVLASIYRDLSRIRDLAVEKCDDKVNMKSLFKLVQVWTWERFSNTRPKVREIPKGEPRISRWDSLAQRSSENVRLSFDDFDSRPYTKTLKNWNPLRIYVEEAMWITIDNNLDDEFVAFARCVRSSQLAGDGFVENYYPNRVAMQFGLAQDLPGLVTRHSNFTEKEAWDDYNKSLDGLKIYVPSRLARGSVTKRYQDWWLKSISEFPSFEEMQKETSEAFNARKIVGHYDDDDDGDIDVSPKVVPLSQVVQKLEEGFPTKRIRSSIRAKKDKIGALPSGWKMNIKIEDGIKISERSNYKAVHTKRARVDDDDDESFMDEEEDSLTIAQRIRSKKTYSDAENTREAASETLGTRRRRFQVVDSDESDDSGPCQKVVSIKMEQRSEEDDDTPSKTQKKRQICDDDVNGSNAEKRTMIDHGTKESEYWLHEDGEKQRYSELKKEEEIDERLKQRKLAIEEIALKLEARMTKVEKSLAKIRDWKTRGNQIIEQEVST